MTKTEYVPYASRPSKQPGAQRLSVTKPFELTKFVTEEEVGTQEWRIAYFNLYQENISGK